MEIKFSKREKVFKKRSLWFNLGFYWELAVFFMLLALISALFFGFFLFRKISSEDGLPADPNAAQPGMIKRERIEEALKYFAERKNKSNQIINSPAPVVDPS